VALLLEDTLSNSLVHNDESDLWYLLASVFIILFREDLFELVQFLGDNHLSHGITNTVSVDEDVVWHGSFIVVSIGCKSALIVLFQDVT
jgi:hypothetical protein